MRTRGTARSSRPPGRGDLPDPARGRRPTLNTRNMLAFDSSIQWDIRSLGGAGHGRVACSTCSSRATAWSRSPDGPLMLLDCSAAHLRGPAGGGVLVGEPPAAAQERFQDGLADRPRLRGVLPARLPRPGFVVVQRPPRGMPPRADPEPRPPGVFTMSGDLPPRRPWSTSRLGPGADAGRRRRGGDARRRPATAPVIDPVPVVSTPRRGRSSPAGLIQRMRLLDALYGTYGPRTVLAAEVAPVAQRAAGSRPPPRRGGHPGAGTTTRSR